MADFDFSAWRQQAAAEPPPPPIVDPEQARENAIADNTRAEEAANDFLSTKQRTLFGGSDAFYGKQGGDAIKASPAVLDGLGKLKAGLMDSLANDAQRRRLGPMLDAQFSLAKDDIARHAAQQYLQWQRQTAQNRIDGLTRDAALLHPDTGMIGSLAQAAGTAARAKERVGGATPDSESEEAAIGTARSGVFNAAIQARLDAGNTEGASELYDNVRDKLTPEHAGSLGPQIATAQKFEATRTYADALAAAPPGTAPDAIEVRHAEATAQNQMDNAGDPEFRTLAQHHINQAFNAQRLTLQKTATDTDRAIDDWVNTPQADGAPQTNLPPPALWNRLSPEQKDDLVVRLARNGNGGLVAVQYQPAQDAEGSAEIAQAPSAGPNKRKPGQPAKSAPPANTETANTPVAPAGRPSENEMDSARAIYANLVDARATSAAQQLNSLARDPFMPQDRKRPIPDNWQQFLPNATLNALNSASKKYNVPRELLARIMWQESEFEESGGQGTKNKGQGIAGVSLDAIADLAQRARLTNDKTRQQELRSLDRMKGPDAVNLAAEYLHLLYDENGKSWPAAVTAYKSGRTVTREWVKGRTDTLHISPDDWRKNAAYLRYVFQGDPGAFDAQMKPETP